jgi:hypothetical protein
MLFEATGVSRSGRSGRLMPCGQAQELLDREVAACSHGTCTAPASSRPQQLVPGLSLVVHVSYSHKAGGNGENYQKKTTVKTVSSGMLRRVIW